MATPSAGFPLEFEILTVSMKFFVSPLISPQYTGAPRIIASDISLNPIPKIGQSYPSLILYNFNIVDFLALGELDDLIWERTIGLFLFFAIGGLFLNFKAENENFKDFYILLSARRFQEYRGPRWFPWRD